MEKRDSEFRCQGKGDVHVVSFHTWLPQDRATARSVGFAIHGNTDLTALAGFLNACLKASAGDYEDLDFTRKRCQIMYGKMGKQRSSQ